MKILRFLRKHKIGAMIGLVYSGSVLYLVSASSNRYLWDICSDNLSYHTCEGLGWTVAFIGVPVYYPLDMVFPFLPEFEMSMLFMLLLIAYAFLGAGTEFLIRKLFKRVRRSKG